MEFLIMPSNSMLMSASRMGYMKDNLYIIGDECEVALDELLSSLQQEDKVSRSFRREIANSKIVEKDLFPILKSSANDVTTCHQIVKVLANLTLPMAILMPVKHQMTPTDWEKRRGVQHMEGTIKTHFANAYVTDLLVEQMKNNLEDAGDYPMEKTYINMMLDIVALIRNVLHIDDIRPCSNNSEMIVANLLEGGFDDVIIDMLARDEGAVWVPSLTQVLGLMFRSHKSEQLLQSLSDNDAAKPENDNPSTEDKITDKNDMETETPPQLPDANGYKDAASSTADIQTDTDSLIGKESPKSSGSYESSLTPLCGALQTGVQLLNSSSSDDSKSSRSTTPTNAMNDNESMSSTSSNYSDETCTSTLDADLITKELCTKLSQFASKFVKKGLDRCILLCQADILKGLEDTCFLWMVNYFLPFASQSAATYSNIRHTLSSAVISNLTFLACHTWQEFQMSISSTGKSNGIFKKLYLVMAVLGQILSQLTRYSEEEGAAALTEEEKKWFWSVSEMLCTTTNLRMLYPMLIRRFQPKSETQQYLRELVRGNTELLKLFSGTCDRHMENGADVMLKHFNNFVDSDVVMAHCHLLSSYNQNTLAENEAVFTFMYHLTVDNPEAAHLLYNIPMFTAFANIWDETDEVSVISQESYELMDYIIYKYTQYAQENPSVCLVAGQEIVENKDKKQSNGLKRKNDSAAEVEWAVGSSKEAKKLLAIHKLLSEDKNVQGLFCIGSGREDSSNEDDAGNKVSAAILGVDEDMKDASTAVVATEFTKHRNKTVLDLSKELTDLGYGTQLESLQNLLLEVCYVKLNCPKYNPAEPTVWQYCANHKSVPLFAFTQKDKAFQSLDLFKSLLQKIGLHQAQDSSHLFPSVPAFWTPEMTFVTAKLLGPVEKGMLKFEVSEDLELLPEHLDYAAALQYTGIDEFASESDAQGEPAPPPTQLKRRKTAQGLDIPGALWMGLIKKANSSNSTILK